MNPYLIVTGDFVKTGGMDRANYALARYVADSGAETHLVAYRVDPELASRPNVIVHRVPKPARSYMLAAPLLDRIGRVWARRITERGGKVIANGGNCEWGDINWVHYVHAAYRRETSAGVAHQIKLALSSRMARTGERRALNRARIAITNSNRTREDLVVRLGIPRSKVHTIYYGTDPELLRPASPDERAALRRELGWTEGTPIVAFVGAIGDRRKGFDTLFEAWKLLCADLRWDAELVVIGTGVEAATWRDRTGRSGMERRIHFLGFRSDVPMLLRACDLLVSAVRYEAYGLNVHEALCCGIPAIVSADAGVAERYPSELKNLLLDDPEGVEELVRKLHSWRSQLDLWKRRVIPFSCKLRQYTWDDMAREILALSCDPA
jgi:glycosyltransferase involved in cell wall biosynthesis